MERNGMITVSNIAELANTELVSYGENGLIINEMALNLLGVKKDIDKVEKALKSQLLAHKIANLSMIEPLRIGDWTISYSPDYERRTLDNEAMWNLFLEINEAVEKIGFWDKKIDLKQFEKYTPVKESVRIMKKKGKK